MVNEMPSEFGRNAVENLYVQFCLLQDLFPPDCTSVRVDVYKLETSNAEVADQVDRTTHQLLTECMIPMKSIEALRKFKVDMKSEVKPAVDISSPLQEETEAKLGVIKLSSKTLQDQRRWFQERLSVAPYSEVLYSFGTLNGTTLSLEQLYASKYSTVVAYCLSSLFLHEREEFATAFRTALEVDENQILENPGSSGGEQEMKQACQALNNVDDIFHDVIDPLRDIREMTHAICRGTHPVDGKVLDAAVGGCTLRRSTWKKADDWQFCTTNLNIHLMSSEFFSHSELATDSFDHTRANSAIHFTPTVTLGR